MSDPREANERLPDLLAARATEGLRDAEAEELLRLLREHPEEDADTFDRAAAALDLTLGVPQAGPLPRHLADRVLARAEEYFADRKAAPNRGSAWRTAAAWAGWALAASLLLGMWLSWRPVSDLTAAERRAELLKAPDVVRKQWAPPTEAAFAGVRGDVVWSDSRQEGYLRLRGMPANDPWRSQYQLWIVDPGRDRHPVDGGVFDIPEGAEEVVIPVSAKLPVSRPQVFAITRERPGGVVVSGGPLLVVAR